MAELSGPGLWTRVVLKKLSEVAGTELNEGNFTGMEEPRVVGDVLVLPVGGFGRGRKLLGRGEGEGDGLVGDGLVGDGVGGRTRGWGE